MDKEHFKDNYRRIKDIGRRRSYNSPYKEQIDSMAETIYSDGNRGQKAALTKLFHQWADDEYELEMRYV